MKFDVELYAAWRRDHPTRPLPREFEEHMVLEIVRLQEEVQAERTDVVAWLRQNNSCCDHASYVLHCASRLAADSIERGDHRREEKP